jgi:monofunctional glycosyltransferase
MYRDAVIATEDRRFAWDPGIDPVGIVRSVFVDIGHDGYIQGGSTLTQQLADNTILSRQKSLSYKLTQAFYAIGIYDTVSKPKTFEMYANVIYFGNGAYGVYNAAKMYFGMDFNRLNDGELTMLAGLPNAPSVYDPFRHFSLARQRQSIVLENMVNAGIITQQRAKAIYQEPIRLVRVG